MSFSAIEVLVEFVEAAAVVRVPRMFRGAAERRRWDTPEERARGRARYALRKTKPMTRAQTIVCMNRGRARKQREAFRAALAIARGRA